MSSFLAPDTAQIERELDRLLDWKAEARVLALRSPTRRAWPDSIERRGRRFRLVWCTSELEVREKLDAAEDGGTEGVVVLTPIDGASLGQDVVARFPRARLDQSDRWTALRHAFRARDVDPRLRTHRWLADLLLERAPLAGYPPAPGNVVDLETAWRAVQEQILGLPEGRADAGALLSWTLDFAGLERFSGLPDDARRGLAERLAATGGHGVRLLLAATEAGHGADALAIGLVCGVVFGEADPRAELRDAAVRMEKLFGGAQVDPQAGQALAAAAQRVLTRLVTDDPNAARAVQSRSEALLAQVRAEAAAGLSPALDVGLEARMKDAAAALLLASESGNRDDVERAWRIVRQVEAHDRAEQYRVRVRRLMMSARLAAWLVVRRTTTFGSFAEAAAAYARDSGFADRARHALREGDAIPEVAATYARLREAAVRRREDENRSFAISLKDWNEGGGQGGDPLPVERFLETIVAALARTKPVLVLVLDGLSFPVWRELAETVAGLGWVELCPDGRIAPPTAVAVLPSVTAVSRASLLCGSLTQGDQATERAGFARHPALVSASRAGHPPCLFHKADLGAGPELPVRIQQAIADPQQVVVGVVHNAVDAQLAGSDQIDLTWSAEGLRQVAALLRVARDAGRIVIMTGDHGHVLEEGTAQESGGTGDRWRVGGPAGEGEIALSGGRVRSPDGATSVVVAWSERLRYATRRRGYHGGASPQEVLIPVAVLGTRAPPPGWQSAPPSEPGWWSGLSDDERIEGYSARVEPPAAEAFRRLPPADPRQPELFAAKAASQPPTAENAPRRQGAPTWVRALLDSELYTAQQRLAGRGAPTDDQIELLLRTLVERGGRLPKLALAQAMATPGFRVAGVVNAARRVLNLDQAQVLVIDGDDVGLDDRLLRIQFGLGDAM